jgi:hypothetical protein
LNTSGRTPPGFDDLVVPEGGEDYTALTTRLSKEIVARQLTVPAIIFLESIKPLSFLGNQMLIFANPVISLVVNSGDYYRFVRMLENRENIERLILSIEEENALDSARRRDLRAAGRSGRRNIFRCFRRGGDTSESRKKEVDGGGQQGDHQDSGD